MKILTFTSLFPNSVQVRHGIFVENRLKHFTLRHPDAEIRVVAPVPWFPLSHSIFGEYGKLARVEREADRGWAPVTYPRYPVLPKIGMNVAPWLMAAACLAPLKSMIAGGFDFDVLDAHYFYPDGVAAMILARRLNKPLVCTARGNDISLLPDFRIPRRQIGKAVSACDDVITVCEALKHEILQLGYRPRRIDVLRNGVDLNLFKPAADRDAVRSRLSFDKFTILSVGSLIERKGHRYVIEAMRDLHDCQLVIVGDGPLKRQLMVQAQSLDVDDRVRFEGTIRHEEIADYYAAADLMVLASSREGWANVLLESMACGTPVVATNVWGTPEVITDPAAGVLVERSTKGLRDGIRQLRSRRPDRAATLAHAQRHSWDETSDNIYNIFQEVTKSGHSK